MGFISFMNPDRYFRITFCLNGEIYSVLCNEHVIYYPLASRIIVYPEELINLRSFYSKFLENYVYGTDEYKSFPYAAPPY